MDKIHLVAMDDPDFLKEAPSRLGGKDNYDK